MYEKHFSVWTRWCDRDECVGLDQPGVYAIALRPSQTAKRRFSWSKDIVYIGMTNSLGGLAARLRQFDRTMAGKLSHGGADRMLFEHPTIRDSQGRPTSRLLPSNAIRAHACQATYESWAMSQDLSSFASQNSPPSLGTYPRSIGRARRNPVGQNARQLLRAASANTR